MSPNTPVKKGRLLHRQTFYVAAGAIADVGTVSTQVRRILRELGVEPDVVRRVGIICFEGETNIAIYTKGGRITVLVWDDRVELFFADAGPGIEDLELVRRPGYSTAPDWVREMGFGAGMGIPNMEKNADVFVFRSRPGKGTAIRATVWRKRDEGRGSCANPGT
ncbi:ATP-binding protein [Candidatus Bipolaricaulota sp. J31]